MFMDTALVSGERWTGKMTSDPGSADTVSIGVTSLKSLSRQRNTRSVATILPVREYFWFTSSTILELDVKKADKSIITQFCISQYFFPNVTCITNYMCTLKTLTCDFAVAPHCKKKKLGYLKILSQTAKFAQLFFFYSACSTSWAKISNCLKLKGFWLIWIFIPCLVLVKQENY